MALAWIEDEDLFFSELREGYEWQKEVCSRLRAYGLIVQLPALSVRTNVSEIYKYKNELDLRVNGKIVEVKSRRLSFTSPQDFPYECALVDTVNGYDQKSPKPTFVLSISRETGSIIGVHGASQPFWYKRKMFDNIRYIRDLFYVCRRKYMLTLDEILRYFS